MIVVLFSHASTHNHPHTHTQHTHTHARTCGGGGGVRALTEVVILSLFLAERSWESVQVSTITLKLDEQTECPKGQFNIHP